MMKQSCVTNSTLRMGEMSAAAAGEVLRTLLGSCVGLALHDREKKVGGLAHIVLPESRGTEDRPGKYVNTAIPTLIEEIEKLVKGDLTLRAKIAGGATMFSTDATASIGRQNINKCEEVLSRLGIPIVARHCGGEHGRRMSLDAASGNVVVEIAGQPPVEL